MEKSFLEYYDFYEVACKDRLHLQGQTMQVTMEPLLLVSETLPQTFKLPPPPPKSDIHICHSIQNQKEPDAFESLKPKESEAIWS